MQQAVVGLREYIGNNGFVLFYLVAMLVCVFRLKDLYQSKAKKFVWYALAAGLAVLCPISAKLLMVYQTGFYSYPHIWSFVPLTAVSAWFLCELLFQSKKKQIFLWIAFVAIFFVYGNQGAVNTSTALDEAWEKEVRELLQEVGQENFEEGLLWAPKEILEYSRKASGEIKVLYGRSMWEAEAGAYDYEYYLDELTAAYLWMESLGEKELDLEETKWIFENVLAQPLSVVMFPLDSMEELEESWKEAAKEAGYSFKEEFVFAQYYVAIMDR